MKFRILTPESDVSASGTLSTDMIFHYFEKCRVSFMSLIGCRADTEFDLFEVTIMPTKITWNILDVHVDVVPSNNNKTHCLFLNIAESDMDIAIAKYQTSASDYTANSFLSNYLKTRGKKMEVILPAYS